MPKNNSNKLLWLLLALLIVVILLTQVFKFGNTKNTFNSNIITIDTAAITSISITTQENPLNTLKFNKQPNNEWVMTENNNNTTIDKQKINGLFYALLAVKPQALVSNNPSQFANYDVQEGKGTQVKVMQNTTEVANFIVGKFTLSEPTAPKGATPNPAMQQQQQQQPNITSYVRLANKNEVYAVNGMLSMAFNRKPEDFLPTPNTPVDTIH